MSGQATVSALADQPRAQADHRVTIAQIGTHARMALGMRDWLHDDPRGELHATIGMGTQTAKVIIVYGADDTYHIEFGRLRRKRGEVLPEWKTLHVLHDVYCDQLGEVLVHTWEHTIRH